MLNLEIEAQSMEAWFELIIEKQGNFDICNFRLAVWFIFTFEVHLTSLDGKFEDLFLTFSIFLFWLRLSGLA